jgi:tRNA threonylcarbamoyladenosine biosynthesis protein TsaE
MEIISRSLDETKKAAADFAARLQRSPSESAATVVALQGELGAGKTTFVQYLGEALGIPDLMQSPTFVIERRYQLHKPPFAALIHIDAYRIEKPDELLVLKFADDLVQKENLILIEWADRVTALLPPRTIHITFTHEGADTRGIRIKES